MWEVFQLFSCQSLIPKTLKGVRIGIACHLEIVIWDFGDTSPI